MPRLLLVRHAQSENNLSNARIREQFRDDPERALVEAERAREPDPVLSDTGLEQTALLAQALAPVLVEADGRALLVTSPMRRALQTAAPLAARAGLDRRCFVCEAELYEVGGCYYGDEAHPSTTAAQIEAEYALRCRGIPSGGWYAGRAGRESSEQARARVDRVIAWAEATLATGEHELIVVVAHGDLLSRWLRRWLGVPWGRSLAFVHANTGITSLGWRHDEGLLLEFVNDLRHLPEQLRTGDSDGWWRYVLPEFDIVRYRGWSEIPATLASELALLRRHLLEPEGKSLTDYANSDARSVHIVARAEGRLAGYVQYDGELGRLRQLIVSPSHRRGRLGRHLVAEIEREARRAGRRELLVHAWVESIGFYRALGFVARGEVEAHAGVPWQAMIKPLG